MGKTVNVKMLGEFKISHNGKALSESGLKMNQLLTLLSYVIYNRNKQLVLDNIFSVLWPEENSDNPAHALRNLVYRVRTILKQNLDSETPYVITLENNCYGWNRELTIVCDVNQFEDYIKAASDTSAPADERISKYLKALELYGNDFLSSLSYQDWIIPIAAYYRHMYTQAVISTAPLLMLSQRYDEALKVCLRAIEIDPLCEELHRYIMDIYYRLNRYELAIQHYQYASGVFYRELGISLSKEARDLSKQITSAAGSTAEVDINVIKKTMSADEDFESPLFCDYDNMRCLFSLQLRSMERVRVSQFLVLITVSTKTGKTPPPELLEKEMRKLKEALKHSLRRNDVVAEYSLSQYLIMLSSLTYENAVMVKDRIAKDYGEPGGRINISYSIVAV